MDLQMPEMDGYQATTRLRSHARFASLPIIAMTAHATMEERERCLAAGMNDHVSKPIDPAHLIATVGRFVTPAEAPVAHASSRVENVVPVLPPIANLDANAGLSRVGGNHRLFIKLLRQFVEQQCASVAQIRDALTAGDTATAERVAHTVKGVSGNLGAREVQAAAGILEKRIRDRASAEDLDSATRSLAAALDPLLSELRQALRQTESESQPSSVATSPGVVDVGRVRAAASQLKTLLADLDPGAADFVAANASTLAPLFDDSSRPAFEARVAGYDFDGAQGQLEHALEHFLSHERPVA
jgi:CheY-like chemotaxis protein